MNLLLDANISWRLTTLFEEHFLACYHVDNIDLTVPAKDDDIWKYAKEKNLIIVTNDEDFLNLINLRGFPPKVILLRTGNQSNTYIASLIIRHKADIQSLSETNEYGLIEIY